MPTAQSQPDLAASQDAIRATAAQVVERLRNLLGARLVAFLAGVRDARALQEWVEGRPIKNQDVLPRLREALRIAIFLSEHDGPETVQAWFQGLNPQLDDRVPLEVLRDASRSKQPSKDVAAVVAAARDFASR